MDQFILDHLDTIPHLEALLLLWNDRPRSWSVEHTAGRLFLTPEAALEILQDLARQGLVIATDAETWQYLPGPEQDRLMTALDLAYRRELIRISRLIHSKPSAAIRAFADAFRMKKERE